MYSADPAYSFENDGAEGSGGTAGAAPTAGGEEPVTHVNWRDAMVWCSALTEWYNAQLHRFRLPVSKEREMAARYRGSDTTNTVQDTINGTDFSNPADGIFWTRGDSASGAADLHSNSDASSEVAWYGNSCLRAPREVFFSGF